MNRILRIFIPMLFVGMLLGSITPAIKAEGMIDQSLAYVRNLALSLVKRSIIPVALIGGAGVAYAKYVKSQGKDWTETIKKAQKVTYYFDETASWSDELMYWKYPEVSAYDLLVCDRQQVYSALQDEKKRGETEQQFISRLQKAITQEKAKLEALLQELDTCLGECQFIPQSPLISSVNLNNPIKKINKVSLRRFDKEMNQWIPEEWNEFKQLIEDLGSDSYLNPKKIFRQWVFPFETAAIREYWKIYQLLLRLRAISDALYQRRITLNNDNKKLLVLSHSASDQQPDEKE